MTPLGHLGVGRSWNELFLSPCGYCGTCQDRRNCACEGGGREGKAGVNRVSYFKSVTCQYPLTHNRQGREEFDSFLTCHPSSQVWNLGRGAFNNYVDQVLPNLNHLPHSSGKLWTFHTIPTFCSSDHAWTFY